MGSDGEKQPPAPALPAWFWLLRAAGLLLVGIWLIVYDATMLHGDSPILLGTGLALCGLVPSDLLSFFRR